MTTTIRLAVIAATLCGGELQAAGRKLTHEDRLEIIRGLSAEYATVKTALPRSKKALEFSSNGTWDKAKWIEMGRENGPAARVGDVVQVTKVDINGDNIEFEINGGFRTGPKWHERIQVGTGQRTAPIGQSSAGRRARWIACSELKAAYRRSRSRNSRSSCCRFSISKSGAPPRTTSIPCPRRCKRPSRKSARSRAWTKTR